MALTVGQLKAILHGDGVSDEMIVVLARDSEGNGFAPVSEDLGDQIWSHSLGFYDGENNEVLTPPDDNEKDHETLENWAWAQEHGESCIRLWPAH